MNLEGEFVFQGSRSEVWNLLQDPDVLANCIPGTKKLEKTGEDEFESTTEIRVGPVNGLFTNKVALKDKLPPQSYTILVDSKGSQGFAKGSANVKLVEEAANTTLLKYEAELQVGGRLASVGQRMLDTVGKSLTRQGLEAMNNALKARISPGNEEAEFTAPSQTDIVKEVAKDVVKESFLSNRVVWAIAALIVLFIVVWLIFK
jgi:carbon monoxide dehydrogenase subunit G